VLTLPPPRSPNHFAPSFPFPRPRPRAQAFGVAFLTSNLSVTIPVPQQPFSIVYTQPHIGNSSAPAPYQYVIYANDGTVLSWDAVTTCHEGSYVDTKGGMACKPCPPGTFSDRLLLVSGRYTR